MPNRHAQVMEIVDDLLRRIAEESLYGDASLLNDLAGAVNSLVEALDNLPHATQATW